jgi:hypothetical protein
VQRCCGEKADDAAKRRLRGGLGDEAVLWLGERRAGQHLGVPATRGGRDACLIRKGVAPMARVPHGRRWRAHHCGAGEPAEASTKAVAAFHVDALAGSGKMPKERSSEVPSDCGSHT